MNVAGGGGGGGARFTCILSHWTLACWSLSARVGCVLGVYRSL